MYRFASSANQTSYRSCAPLSNEQIARHAPSVLAEEPHHSRGDRYSFIPTIRVLDGLRSEGFQPFEVRQTRVRDDDRAPYTKHMVRLRHASDIAGEEVPELVLLNSHDGSSAYQLLSGIFRMVCSNGLIAGDLFGDVRVRHSGKVVDDVIEGAVRILENAEEIASRVNTYKAITLDAQEQKIFANAALQLRWDEKPPINAVEVLRPSRAVDAKPDLWRTFNRVQENIIKGGMHGRAKTGRRMTTRGVASVNENVRLNRALWTLADQMAQLKA